MNASDLHVDAPVPALETWRDARRVLAVRLDNLGDVLVTTPAIHAMRESLPDAAITLLASPVGAQAGRLNPDVAEVVVYNAPWMDPWSRLRENRGEAAHLGVPRLVRSRASNRQRSLLTHEEEQEPRVPITSASLIAVSSIARVRSARCLTAAARTSKPRLSNNSAVFSCTPMSLP